MLENANQAAKELGESKSTYLARAGGYREKLMLPAAEKELLQMLAVLLELPGQPVLLGHLLSPLHIASTCQQDVSGPPNVTCG